MVGVSTPANKYKLAIGDEGVTAQSVLILYVLIWSSMCIMNNIRDE
jgi:hypothetical protein